MDTIPRCCTLEGFCEISAGLEGFDVRRLEPCDTAFVRTQNTDYQLYWVDPGQGRAIIHGGRYFAEPQEVTVAGSTLGGSMLKAGWIAIGLRMEVCLNGKRIVTSPVRSLRVERPTADSVQ